jgi:hypothetical protein
MASPAPAPAAPAAATTTTGQSLQQDTVSISPQGMQAAQDGDRDAN